MEDKYNILITYSGDGDFKFIVKRLGEISIAKNKPVYIYNVPSSVINDLRTLRRLLLTVTIGAKPEGAFRIYNFEDYIAMPRAVPGQRPNLVAKDNPLSNAEITAILKGGSSVVVSEEPKKEGTKTTSKTTTKKPTNTANKKPVAKSKKK